MSSPPLLTIRSKPLTVTRKQFLMFWFSTERKKKLKQNKCLNCSLCSAAGRSTARTTARGTVSLLGMSNTRFTKRKIYAETERRVRNDTIIKFRSTLGKF